MKSKKGVEKAAPSSAAATPASREALFVEIYEDLRVRASRLLNANKFNTMGTTALVNETYTKLLGSGFHPFDREHFFFAAANAMRQILVDQARFWTAEKRDQRMAVTLDDTIRESLPQAADVLELDSAIEYLRKRNDRLAQIVELHFFAGLNFAEIAQLLGLSLSTVERSWRTARAVLYRVMKESRP